MNEHYFQPLRNGGRTPLELRSSRSWYRLPVMNGQTMLDELRWLGYQIPVLPRSGELDLPALRNLMNEGAQGHFSKPFNLPSLKQSSHQIFKKDRMSGSFLQPFHTA